MKTVKYPKSLITTRPSATQVVAFSIVAVTLNQQAIAEPDPSGTHEAHLIEEIIVTAPFRKVAAETALPVTVLSGEGLQEQVANSLGETLQGEIGMASASFGTGVGQPIIRGQTGNRVKVLQNGAGVTDAASVSPDHANGVETILAERLEVIRGPSTLLYGSGAIGGVVNVIDGRIPNKLSDKAGIDIQQTRDSVNDENQSVLKLDLSMNQIAIHLEGFHRSSGNVDINGDTIDLVAIEQLADLLDDHDEEHAEDEEESLPNTNGTLLNSASDADGYSAGMSYVGDRGYVGIAFTETNNDYGLPPGVHQHGHGEEHDDHNEEPGAENHDEDHEEDHGEDHEEVEFVRIAMEKARVDLRGEVSLEQRWFDKLQFSMGRTDYQHREIEILEDGSRELGTLFENKGSEGRVTLDLTPSETWSGVIGFQFSDVSFKATGEEAFIAETDMGAAGLFAIGQYTMGELTLEAGARVESNHVDPVGACEYDERSVSASASLLYDVSDSTNLLVGLSHSSRNPSVEELYSNISSTGCTRPADDHDLVFHAATNLLEIGNPDLDREVSNNLELGWRKHDGRFRGEISLYYNEISDYIYLDVTGDEFEEQAIAIYDSRDARFSGVEAKATLNLIENAATTLEASVFGDLVRARFESGGDIPRIAPAKVGTSLALVSGQWSAHLNLTRVMEQDRTGVRELSTDAYTRLSFYGDYHWRVGSHGEFKIFVQGTNLLDNEIRNHASLLKHYAPEPGRNIRIGLRYTY